MYSDCGQKMQQTDDVLALKTTIKWPITCVPRSETLSLFHFPQICKKDFEGFKKLFHRFLQVKGPSVEWPKINRPPEDSVRETVQLSRTNVHIGLGNIYIHRTLIWGSILPQHTLLRYSRSRNMFLISLMENVDMFPELWKNEFF